MKRCYGFCAFECVSGQCPQALAQSCDWYTDVGFDVPKSCSDCWYNTGQCEDCVFEGSEQCVYPKNTKNCDLGGNDAEWKNILSERRP